MFGFTCAGNPSVTSLKCFDFKRDLILTVCLKRTTDGFPEARRLTDYKVDDLEKNNHGVNENRSILLENTPIIIREYGI